MEEDGQGVDKASITSVKPGLHSAMDHLLLVSSILLSSEWEFSLGMSYSCSIITHTKCVCVCQGATHMFSL